VVRPARVAVEQHDRRADRRSETRKSHIIQPVVLNQKNRGPGLIGLQGQVLRVPT
jgi:hypothetical protein